MTRIQGPTKCLDIGPSWHTDDKFKLGLDFPNLPYYVDKDVKLTQSLAILRYIGKTNGLSGETPQEEATIDMLIQTAEDILLAFAYKAYDPEFVSFTTYLLLLFY